MNNTTTGIAAAGLASPLWLWDLMQQGAMWATVGLPLISFIWIALQVAWFIYSRYKEIRRG